MHYSKRTNQQTLAVRYDRLMLRSERWEVSPWGRFVISFSELVEGPSMAYIYCCMGQQKRHACRHVHQFQWSSISFFHNNWLHLKHNLLSVKVFKQFSIISNNRHTTGSVNDKNMTILLPSFVLILLTCLINSYFRFQPRYDEGTLFLLDFP